MNTVVMSEETPLTQPHKSLVGVAILSLSEGKNNPDFHTHGNQSHRTCQAMLPVADFGAAHSTDVAILSEIPCQTTAASSTWQG